MSPGSKATARTGVTEGIFRCAPLAGHVTQLRQSAAIAFYPIAVLERMDFSPRREERVKTNRQSTCKLAAKLSRIAAGWRPRRPAFCTWAMRALFGLHRNAPESTPEAWCCVMRIWIGRAANRNLNRRCSKICAGSDLHGMKAPTWADNSVLIGKVSEFDFMGKRLNSYAAVVLFIPASARGGTS